MGFGTVMSDDCLNIVYQGSRLESNTLYRYEVKTRSEAGDLFKGESVFRTGFFEQSDWKGYLIKPGAWCGGSVCFLAAKLFREFTVKNILTVSILKNATAYVAGLGCYEFSINGQKVGDEVLSNAQTNYEKTVLYRCYDVTDMLKGGDNVVGLMLGNGWANRTCSDMGWFTDNICARMQLELEYIDGTKETIFTEPKKWRCTAVDEMPYNSIYMGTVYNAMEEKSGWDMPGFELNNPGLVKRVEVVEGPEGILKSQLLEPERVVEVIKPVSMEKTEAGTYRVDFGCNHSGSPRIRFNEEAGTAVTITFSEILDDEGNLNPASYAPKIPKDMYICAGRTDEVFEPRFTYHAYRYMEIDGVKGELSSDDVESLVVHNDISKKSDFKCGNSLINRMQEVVERTETNNQHGAPTDCPHRERAGWLNDMTGRAEQAVYNYNMARMYAKWTNDIRDTQGKVSGTIMDTAPFVHGPKSGAPVNSSFLIAPWLIYLHDADRRILEDNYEGMKKWEGYLSLMSEDGLLPIYHYGDWSGPEEVSVKDTMGCNAISAVTPGELVASALYYYNAVLLAKMAGVMNNSGDEAYYVHLADDIKAAFNSKWLDRETGDYATGSQGCNAIALWTGLVPEEMEQKTAGNLAEDVIKHGYHLTTGNICTKYLIEMLFRYDYGEVAYKLLTQTTYLSWGYMFGLGATSYWERWEYMNAKEVAMGSMDHPMQGSACSAFHKYLAGIRPCEKAPGFAEIQFKPYPVREIGFVRDCLDTGRGKVVSKWSYEEDGGIVYEFSIPFNSSAVIEIPIRAASSVVMNGDTVYKADESEAEQDERILGIDKGRLKIRAVSGDYRLAVENRL